MLHSEARSERPVRLIRRVSFSSGHRYWLPALDPDENEALFGRYASPFSHGHNYVLDVAVEGLIDPATGMVVNIKAIDEVLQEVVVDRFDQKSINDQIEHFQSRSPSLENLLLFISSLLSAGALPRQGRLAGLRLYEKPDLYADYCESEGTWKMTLTRVYEFAASHRLHAPELSPAENLEIFGKCNNPAGHGHNYVLEVGVEGEPDVRTGMLCDIEALDQAVVSLVVERYDHRHLNVDVPEFKDKAPTSEVIAQEIFTRLDGRLPARLSRICLHETARNSFEIVR